MKTMLIFWLTFLCYRYCTKRAINVWARKHPLKAAKEVYPIWMLTMVCILFLLGIVSVIFTFKFLFSL